MDTNFLPPERTCYTCKKHFYAREKYYAYQRGRDKAKKFFCSYSCMRDYDRKEEGKKLSKQSKKRDDIVRLRNAGKTRREVASLLGVTEDMVDYYDHRYGGLESV